MAVADFAKPFTQQEPLPDAAVERAAEIMRSGRLHRYNTIGNEVAEASLLEEEYARYQKAPYCLAVTSGGQAMQIALRAVGLKPGDAILANAYTLAPVPGAMYAVGAKPVFVEIDENWRIDCADLAQKADASGARFLMLSHMRGHIADMNAIMEICDARAITVIEDCAHTMGASWDGQMSGNFGKVACFSTQTYKHMNSGEGGFLTTSDPEVAARAVIMSGSYMLYEKHGAIPDSDVFDAVKLDAPNCSARMDNLRAALLRAQLPALDQTIARWNARYTVLHDALSELPGLALARRGGKEGFVGSSIQFRVTGVATDQIPDLVTRCGARGVELKWFGAAEPKGFTSRYDSWTYLGDLPDLPRTKAILAQTCDMRIPLTFSLEDCLQIAAIIAEEVTAMGAVSVV